MSINTVLKRMVDSDLPVIRVSGCMYTTRELIKEWQRRETIMEKHIQEDAFDPIIRKAIAEKDIQK